MARARLAARFDASHSLNRPPVPVNRSAKNSTTSDHTIQMPAHTCTAHVSVVPNVTAAMLCASDWPAN